MEIKGMRVIMNNKERGKDMKEIDLIKQLSTSFGPSGMEDAVVSVVKEEVSSFMDCKEDTMRNLIMHRKKETGKLHIHLDAHGDEVGFIIQAIKPNGLLRFLPLGGWICENVAAQKVWIKNREGKLVEGVVCSKPPHFTKKEERHKHLDFEDLLIDVGASSKEEVINEYGISIGSFAVPAVSCSYDEKHEMFLGKAFDCRIGCAALIQTLKDLEKKEIGKTISASISAQEEVGERGMKSVMQQINPDLMICFEGCPADDTFEEEYMIQSALKKGPMLRHFDVSMITHPRFQRFALDIAKKYNIPVQESVRRGGGTNGGISHTCNIPTIVIGIPTRYAHTFYSYTSMQDYKHAVLLAEKIIEELNEKIYSEF